MEQFDDLVTDSAIRLADVRSYTTHERPRERYLGRYRVCATSGSSGQPGFFLYDEAEWLSIMASFARGQAWSGLGLGLLPPQRMATVASVSPWQLSSQVALAARSWLRPSLRLAASTPLPQLVAQLNAWRPALLIAYASMAGLLAEEQLAGQLQIQPRVVFTSSEVLTRQTRAGVRRAWGAEPFNQYGATETADIAAEHVACRRMHLFEDLVITEVVDEHCRPVPPGAYGAKVLVTSLFSRTQPLIRYELNDSVRRAADEHGCGLSFAVLDSLQGRMEDALSLPARAGDRIAVQPVVFNRVMDIAEVTGWQIAQQADGRLQVLITGAHGPQVVAELPRLLAESLARAGACAPNISVRRVVDIPISPSGKTPLVRAYSA